jgi:ankyrin repeat protein
MKCTVKELNELRCIALYPPSTYVKRDWIVEQQFPLVHNIIFGRSPKPLWAELASNPDAVGVKDAMGRTALDWATARAQLSDMRLLIEYGSSVNTMDRSGRTTALHAVDSHNDDALHMVLKAGANPNPEVPNGLFRSSPLTAASFGGLVTMIKLLIEFGAKVDACNPEGRTALQAVASIQNVECADILLTNGADLGYISRNGHSPLTTAIIHNSHAVLKLFIDRCDISHIKELQLLCIVAESADAETMSILMSSDLLKQTLLNGDSFAAGRETLRSRTDYDEKLGNAFEDLLATTFRTVDEHRIWANQYPVS